MLRRAPLKGWGEEGKLRRAEEGYCGQGRGRDWVFRSIATLRYVRSHLETQHRIELSTEPSEPSARSTISSSIDHLFEKQKEKVDVEQERVLEGVQYRNRILQALIHLIARTSLPQTRRQITYLALKLQSLKLQGPTVRSGRRETTTCVALIATSIVTTRHRVRQPKSVPYALGSVLGALVRN
jgi:hypothetical protein